MKKSRNVLIYPFILIGFLLVLSNSCKTEDAKDNDPVIEDTKVTDIDGNVYHTVTIGSQIWMVENLNTSKYRNGDPIPNVSDAKAWSQLASGALCNYNNDATIGSKYGKLYNRYAVIDSRNIAPIGWHIASSAEWKTLLSHVAAFPSSSGSQAKDLASKTDWVYFNTQGTIGNDLSKNNASGFTALPGGYRVGTFYGIGTEGRWWTSGLEEYLSIVMASSISTNDQMTGGGGLSSWAGLSVRCVKD